MTGIYLVRHGRPLVDPTQVAADWELDPAAYDDVWRLRTSGRLPAAARWFCSSEPKAISTAQLLTDGPVGVVAGLGEHRRVMPGWHDDFPALVEQAFADPDVPAVEGWEPLAVCRSRIAGTVEGLVKEYPGEALVLVGHGTAWTVLVSELTSSAPDLKRWRSLQMPDVIELVSRGGAWRTD